MNKLIIVTPFKCGSSTLSEILRKYYGYILKWEQDKDLLDGYNKNNKFILRGHTCLNHNLLTYKRFDIWFTIIRKPTDIYLSTYFQDITTKSYPYYFGDENKVLQCPIEDIINHFLKFNWDDFNHCSYFFNFNAIYCYTKIKILENSFDKEKGYSIYKSPVRNIKVVVLTIEALNKIQDILSELDILNITNVENIRDNEATSKWYNEKYKEFKKNIPKSFFEKYEHIDNIFLDHFYN
jgi:uncharacterized protein YktA (UPF0223 family)